MKDQSGAAKAGSILASVGRGLGWTVALLAATGAYDFSRNKKIDKDLAERYFTGNGLFTWLLSPLNTALDALALPYRNPGVYKLTDLPKPYQVEIQRLIDAAHSDDVVGKLEETAKDRKKTMMFFKWYGSNVDSPISIPAFHEPYQFIQTIGVSVFNKRQSTTKHFGPFRPMLRVLYNINDTVGRGAHIVCGDVDHYWEDDKLFIFDDTLAHQSFNESDQARYCLFVDILRPSRIPAFFQGLVSGVQFLLRGVNYVFYKSWDVVEN